MQMMQMVNAQQMADALAGAPQQLEIRRDATSGPDLQAATAAATAAATLQKQAAAKTEAQRLQQLQDDEDDEDGAKIGKLAAMLKSCNAENMKMGAKMFADGASLRPGVAGICLTQMLVLGALILGGGLGDADAYIAISSKSDLEALINYGTGDAAYIKAGEAYRIVSPLFIHGGVVHLTGVLLIQVYFGENLEFSMKSKKFVALWFISGVAGVMMGAAYNKKFAVIGACTSCAGLLGATLTYTLIHWNEWSKPYKHIATIIGLIVMDMAMSFFPEARLLTGPLMGHAIAGMVGMGLGFAFHPAMDKHHAGAVVGGKLLAFVFTGLFYLSIMSFLFFINDVKKPQSLEAVEVLEPEILVPETTP
jgi:membrane associated rhomboid family serine protease